MRKSASMLAACLAVAPALAEAAQPCLSPAEASSLAAYALPSALSGTAKRCAPALAPTSFLRSDGNALVARYAARKARNWPQARAAFLKIGSKGDPGTDALLSGLPDASLQQMLDAVIEGMVAQEIPAERCQAIDHIVSLLAPLPAENTADLIVTVMGLASEGSKVKSDKFSICKA